MANSLAVRRKGVSYLVYRHRDFKVSSRRGTSTNAVMFLSMRAFYRTVVQQMPGRQLHHVRA